MALQTFFFVTVPKFKMIFCEPRNTSVCSYAEGKRTLCSETAPRRQFWARPSSFPALQNKAVDLAWKLGQVKLQNSIQLTTIGSL